MTPPSTLPSPALPRPGRDVARWLFGCGALWNLAIGLTVMLAPRWAAGLLYRLPLPEDDRLTLLLAQDFGACVLMFGLGYGWFGIFPERNRALVGLGIMGKLGVVVSFAQRFVAGQIQPLALAAAGGDLVFAGLFAWYLWRYPAQPSRSASAAG